MNFDLILHDHKCSDGARNFIESGQKNYVKRYFFHMNNFTLLTANFTFSTDNFTFLVDLKILVLPHMKT